MADTYATFGLGRSLHQVRYALNQRQHVGENMQAVLDWVKLDESRMEAAYGSPIKGLRILEIGPGQDSQRALYFGVHNNVVGLDLDVIPQGFDPVAYAQMVKNNGVGRLAKTVGRKLILGKAHREAWAEAIGVSKLNDPQIRHGDICRDIPEKEGFDMAMTWSVFEHLPDPKAALENLVASIKPGGIIYISLHLWTSNNGHHDIRSFTGNEDALPLWAHLRPDKQELVEPSSWLNEWRLGQYRNLFAEVTPGAQEFLEQYEHPEVYGPHLKGDLRDELSDFSDDELLTVNLVYLWKKPKE
jgi:SAM-dependent methyltransferase